jgi:predicted SAM-dependent methyltransferase
MKLLHIAPEANLQKYLKTQSIKYLSADLNSPLAEIKMDITDINFPSEYFDAIICNHVLEHIIDDKKAMMELFRVLKVGGWSILQVPYSPVLHKTYEDTAIVTAQEREHHFGQFDHVRIYGNDYINRLISVGFTVETKKVESVKANKFALNVNETIFFAKK